MIFESHAHYESERFDPDREQLLASMKENGIGTIINVGSSVETCKETVKLMETYDFIYGALGVHPSDISGLNEESLKWIEEMAAHPKTVAVGEIGLDYYWEKDPEIRKQQKYWFRRQLELAERTGLPVIIHSRDAAQDTMEIMKEDSKKGIRGVIHCYSYSEEMALEYVKMGYYIGVGGVVTFKNARKLKEAVEAIPAEKILLETDCPYMAPEPYRGKRNSSLYLPLVAEKIGELKGLSREEVISITTENATRLFRKAGAAES